MVFSTRTEPDNPGGERPLSCCNTPPVSVCGKVALGYELVRFQLPVQVQTEAAGAGAFGSGRPGPCVCRVLPPFQPSAAPPWHLCPHSAESCAELELESVYFFFWDAPFYFPTDLFIINNYNKA